jgi:hypothetical protein
MTDTEDYLLTLDTSTKRRITEMTIVYEPKISQLKMSNLSKVLGIAYPGSLRLIFAPRLVATQIKYDMGFYSEDPLPSPTRLAFSRFLAEVYTAFPGRTEVFLISKSGHCAVTELALLEQLIREDYDKIQHSNSTIDPGIRLRTGPDYLRLGITDEIDEADLKGWRRAEARMIEQELVTMRQMFQAEEEAMWDEVEKYVKGMGDAYRMVVHLDVCEEPINSANSGSSNRQVSVGKELELEDAALNETIRKWDLEIMDMVRGWDMEKASRLYMESEEEYLAIMAEVDEQERLLL